MLSFVDSKIILRQVNQLMYKKSNIHALVFIRPCFFLVLIQTFFYYRKRKKLEKKIIIYSNVLIKIPGKIITVNPELKKTLVITYYKAHRDEPSPL